MNGRMLSILHQVLLCVCVCACVVYDFWQVRVILIYYWKKEQILLLYDVQCILK